MRLVDLTGSKFSNWEVLSRNGSDTTGHPMWKCKCDCGRIATILGSNLVRKRTSECVGCYTAHNRLRPYEALYNLLCRASKERYEVKLTYEEYLTFTSVSKCFYCGTKVTWEPHVNPHKGIRGSAYHLDRKDNSLGYSKENCVVCCPRCNRAKSNHFTYEEWRQIGKLIRTWKKTLRDQVVPNI